MYCFVSDGIVELISGHLMKAPEDGPSNFLLCLKCGSNPKATALPWVCHICIGLAEENMKKIVKLPIYYNPAK